MSTADAALLAPGIELLSREAMYLDEQRWDEWLALYAPDCEYWVPTWTAEGNLTTSPQTELSLIYYTARGGLEDRIVRIRSGRSPASLPMPRTTHVVSNILPLEPPAMVVNHTFFGRAEYELQLREASWVIAKKKTILQNDRIPLPIDIYCL